jgi:hypothetical protein
MVSWGDVNTSATAACLLRALWRLGCQMWQPLLVHKLSTQNGVRTYRRSPRGPSRASQRQFASHRFVTVNTRPVSTVQVAVVVLRRPTNTSLSPCRARLGSACRSLWQASLAWCPEPVEVELPGSEEAAHSLAAWLQARGGAMFLPFFVAGCVTNADSSPAFHPAAARVCIVLGVILSQVCHSQARFRPPRGAHTCASWQLQLCPQCCAHCALRTWRLLGSQAQSRQATDQGSCH